MITEHRTAQTIRDLWRLMHRVAVALGVGLLLAAPVAAEPVITGIAGAAEHGGDVTMTGSGFGEKASAAPWRASYMHPDPEMSFQRSGNLSEHWSNGVPDLLGLQSEVARVHRPTHTYYGRLAYMDAYPHGGLVVPLPGTATTYAAWWDRFDPGFDPSFMETGASNFKWVYYGAGRHPHNAISVTDDGAALFTNTTVGVAGDTSEERRANLELPFGGGFYAQPASWITRYALPIGEWYFVEVLHTVNSAPGVHDGSVELRINNQTVYRAVNVAFDTDEAPDAFDRVSLGGNYGWVGPPDLVQYRTYGDVYVDRTQARVVLCDAPVFADCRQLELQVPTAWSDGEIAFAFNAGAFDEGATAYLYVVDAAGEVSADGWGLRIDDGPITRPDAGSTDAGLADMAGQPDARVDAAYDAASDAGARSDGPAPPDATGTDRGGAPEAGVPDQGVAPDAGAADALAANDRPCTDGATAAVEPTGDDQRPSQSDGEGDDPVLISAGCSCAASAPNTGWLASGALLVLGRRRHRRCR